MAKFNKPLKSIEVHTRLGETFNASDTIDKPIASWAYDEFIKGEKMHIFNDPQNYIPYEAVDYLVLTKSTAEVDRKDAYCESGTAIVGRGKVCESGAGC